MKLINADMVVHWEAYDDEHESFTRHSGTIAEFLDQMTDEGCPETVDAIPIDWINLFDSTPIGGDSIDDMVQEWRYQQEVEAERERDEDGDHHEG